MPHGVAPMILDSCRSIADRASVILTARLQASGEQALSASHPFDRRFVPPWVAEWHMLRHGRIAAGMPSDRQYALTGSPCTA